MCTNIKLRKIGHGKEKRTRKEDSHFLTGGNTGGWDWLQSSLALSWPAELGGGGADGLAVQCFLALGA